MRKLFSGSRLVGQGFFRDLKRGTLARAKAERFGRGIDRGRGAVVRMRRNGLLPLISSEEGKGGRLTQEKKKRRTSRLRDIPGCVSEGGSIEARRRIKE